MCSKVMRFLPGLAGQRARSEAGEHQVLREGTLTSVLCTEKVNQCSEGSGNRTGEASAKPGTFPSKKRPWWGRVQLSGRLALKERFSLLVSAFAPNGSKPTRR